jgi:hypothetical protein
MNREELLQLDDDALIALCDMHIYKASGPGGQHRNKVSSAIRLRHCETGISATANDSRSQHENKVLAVKRLRMNLALRLRQDADIVKLTLPPYVAECVFTPKKRADGAAELRLEIGRKDRRFWTVAAWLLDVLTACGGRVGDAARLLNISTGNLTSILQDDRHLFAAVQEIRKAAGLKPLS